MSLFESSDGRGGGLVRRAGHTLLAVLCALLLASTFVDHRPSATPLVAGEATYLMQAASLWEDQDLTYTRADYDRLLLASGADPTDLELISASDGRRITFDRPFPYALYLAPFLGFWGDQGFAIANALLLLLVAFFAVRVLERRAGERSAFWVAVLIFASVLFAHVFLATGDLFLFALTTSAFLLLAAADERDGLWRKVLAGILLAVPVATDPLYLPLVLAAWMQPALRGAHRGFVAGLGGGWLMQLLVRWWAGGGLGVFGGSHFRFTPETGFPLVDFSSLEWAPMVHRLSALHWDGAPRFSWGLDLALWFWDGVYLVAGQNLGILPYFAPVLLLILVGSSSGGRRSLVGAAGLWAGAVVVVHPFNFWDGPGGVANGLFLPVYGALWLLLDGPPAEGWRRRFGLWLALPCLLFAVLFLGRLRDSPWMAGLAPRSDWYVTPLAKQLFPYETSQRWLPGSAVVEHGGLALKFLDENAWSESRRQRLMVEGKEGTSMMIGSSLPLDALRLDFGKEAPSRIELHGGTLSERVLRSDGGISFRIEPGGLPRRHATWWTPKAQRLYFLSFHLPGASEEPLPFQLVGERFEEEEE